MVKFPTRLEEILPPQAVSKVLDLLSQPTLTNAVRETLNKVGIKETNPVAQMQDAWRQARGWFESVIERVVEQNEASPAAINATGHLFDGRWSSLPGDSVALQALAAAAVAFQDQVQLEQFACRRAAQRLHASSAILVSSSAAALSLLANCSRFRAGLIVARTDLLRLPGSVDLRAVMTGGANPCTEVGASNGATEQDWQSALASSELALVRISPNSLDGQEAVQQNALASEHAQKVGATVIDVLFDGTFDPQLAALGFPLADQATARGAGVVVLPLDGLLGLPGGAVIAGSAELIEALRHHARIAGSLMQGPMLAAAAACFTQTGTSPTRSSMTNLLLTGIDNLKERARRLAIQLNDTERIALAEQLQRASRLGPSPWHRYQWPSYVVQLTPRNCTADELSQELAKGKHGSVIWTLVEDGKVIVDLRLIEPADDHRIVEALCTQ